MILETICICILQICDINLFVYNFVFGVGFFQIINHNVPEKLMKDMISGSQSFFDLREEEKQEYAGKALFDPIRWGTSFNATADETFFWRDYLKIHVHPHFNVNALTKPAGFRYLHSK